MKTMSCDEMEVLKALLLRFRNEINSITYVGTFNELLHLVEKEIDELDVAIKSMKDPKSKPLVELTCIGCGKTFMGYEPERCCSGMDCACRGMPINPVICSKECYEKLPFRSGQNSAGTVELTPIFKTNSHHV